LQEALSKIILKKIVNLWKLHVYNCKPNCELINFFLMTVLFKLESYNVNIYNLLILYHILFFRILTKWL